VRDSKGAGIAKTVSEKCPDMSAQCPFSVRWHHQDCVDDERTTPPEEPASSRAIVEIAPALAIVWSVDSPARVGEVGLLAESADGAEWVLGRGDDGRRDRVWFFRQRPGVLDRRPPLTSKGISRQQLRFTLAPRTSGGLRVKRIGQPSMRVNGTEAEEADVRIGDTIEIDRQLVLLVTERPTEMPALLHGEVTTPFGEPDADGLLGESPAMWQLRDQLAYARKAPGHVLITGESGTGKELAARAVHARSAREGGPFVTQNAATFTSGLIDAELYGNSKNYPNPGMPERPGLIGAAHGGVLFLDEIGELPQELHARLLRVLDDGGEYCRIGESIARRSNFRLVAATNRDPTSLKFDFLSRLRVRVALPSLRDRREDVPLLARALLLDAANLSPETGGRFVTHVDGRPEPRMTGAFMADLVRLPYETNVREIALRLSTAISRAQKGVLSSPPLAIAPAAPLASPMLSAAPTAADVQAALQREDGNATRAAGALGISRQKLYRLAEKHKIPIR
jgi:DNA-binding NtrC family response regulator